MSDLPSVRNLYRCFDTVFQHPAKFDNLRCCVSKQDERPLLELPREQLTETELGWPINNRGCFASFQQLAWFVPRLMELVADSTDGFEHILSFWRMLHENRENYMAVGLWQSVRETVHEIFHVRTETFAIIHYDLDACRKKGWGLDHFDYVPWADLREEMLGDFFCPEYSLVVGAWQAFFDQWAADANPHRVAHLLDVLKQWFELPDYFSFTFPQPFSTQIENPDYIRALIGRAEPAFQSIASPTWELDIRASLLGLHAD